jgi:phosphatidylglycerophosphatase A
MRSGKLSLIELCSRTIGTTLGSGFFPLAPGTVASAIAAAGLYFLPTVPPSSLLSFILIAFVIGLWASSRCELAWGKDPGRVNWDEVVGQLIALLWLPKTLLIYFTSLLLFRLFDIFKPVPVRTAEKLPAGLGIMADDVVAGVYANLTLQIGRFICEKWI